MSTIFEREGGGGGGGEVGGGKEDGDCVVTTDGGNVQSILSSAATTTMSTASVSIPVTVANDDGDGEMDGRTSSEEKEVVAAENVAKRTVSMHVYRRNRADRGGRGDDGDAGPLVATSVAAESRDLYSLLATSSADRDGGRDEASDADDRGPTLVGVGVPRSQFASWVHYYLTHMTPEGEVVATVVRTSTMEASSSSTTTRKTDSMREERAQVLEGILRHVETEDLDWEEEENENENENEEEEEEKGDALSEVDGGGNGGGARPTASPTRRRREMREAIRRFWREGRLICESTSLLSGGRRRRSRSRSRSRSDDNGERDNNVATDNDDGDGEGGEASSRARAEEEEEGEEEAVEEERRYKLGRFTDALRSYADRLSCIVEDELRDVDDDDDDGDDRRRRPSLLPTQSHPSSSSLTSASSANAAAAAATTVVSTDGDSQWQWRERGEASSASSPKWSISNGELRRFIEGEYGSENARLLMARTLLRKSEDEQLKVRVLLPANLVRRSGVSSL